MKKLTFALAMLLLLGAMMPACGRNGETDPTKGGTADGAGTQEPAKEYTLNVFNWDGRGLNVLVNNNPGVVWDDTDFTWKESLMGEPINDAVHDRNNLIEEMYNVKLVLKRVTRDAHVAAIRSACMAGDGSYDISFNNPRENYTLAQEGYLINLFSVEALELDAPWWDPNAVRDMSVMNRLFMVIGDIGLMYKKSVGTLQFNKDHIRDYGLTSPYKHLEENTWTLDTFTQMLREFMGNIENGEKPRQQRTFGLLGFSDIMATGMIGAGVKFAAKDENDIPALSFYNEKTINVFEKITEFMYDEEIFLSWTAPTGAGVNTARKFVNGESLFHYGELHEIPNLRNMDTDFGIMPLPKYNSEQAEYYHSINANVAMIMALPVRVDENIEKIGAIAHAMGKLGMDLLRPAYYEVSLIGKMSRDEESEISLDIILNSITYDQGYMYNWGNIGTFTLGMSNNRNRDLSSNYLRIEAAAQTQLDRMNDTFADMFAEG